MSDEKCCGACGYPIHMTKEMACDWCRQSADRIEALSVLNKKLILKVSHYSDLLYDQLGTPCEQIRHKQEIEALEAKLAQAVEGLHAVVQHEASTFFGSDGEKNKRASWRGVMRKVRATLAKIKGESHA